MSENQFSVGEKATHFIIDEVAKANTNFRQVLWTGKHSQLVAMTIPVGGEIGDEAVVELQRFHGYRLRASQAK